MSMMLACVLTAIVLLVKKENKASVSYEGGISRKTRTILRSACSAATMGQIAVSQYEIEKIVESRSDPFLCGKSSRATGSRCRVKSCRLQVVMTMESNIEMILATAVVSPAAKMAIVSVSQAYIITSQKAKDQPSSAR